MRHGRSRVPRASKAMQQRARHLRQRMTIPERALWNLLRGKRLGGLKFRRQVPIGPYVVDYYCSECSLVVELDGMTHWQRAREDAERTRYLESQGLSVVRVTNDDVLEQPESVQRYIVREGRKQLANWAQQAT